MADWKKTNYGAPESWDEQVRKERARQFDAKYPTTWRDGMYVGWMGLLIVLFGIATLVCAALVLIKLFS